MKLFAVLALAAATRAGASTPIARVVGLLQGLQGKLEKDFEKEESLYEAYECWYKSVRDGKTESNNAATSRIDLLTSYIADVEAGRIEFTTERVDLEKQVAGLNQDLETAAGLRAKETKDFEAAKDEMERAISALEEANSVLASGTESSLITRSRSVKMLGVRWSLRKALEFGRGVLNQADSKFLEGVLDGDVPKKDWKKLNRKATYKMKYTPQSGKVQKVLKDMERTFKENLAEAEQKEADAESKYQALKGSKESMLQTVEDALTSMVEESGARGLSKSDAQEEVEGLKAQVEADAKFIEETETAYKTKSEEWTARKELRHKELLAISQAISVLHSDEARDTFKTSFGSQGYSLLQVDSHRSRGVRCVANAIKSLSRSTKDARVALVAAQLTSNAAIEKVIESIDKLVGELEKEEGTDLESKETCEKELAEGAQEARMQSLAVDTLSEDVDRAEGKVTELNTQVEEVQEAIKGKDKLKEELTTMRTREEEDFKVSKADDQKAVELIEEAKLILSKWQDTQSPSLLQEGESIAAGPKKKKTAQLSQHRASTSLSHRQPAGEAPLPPPATWEEPGYGGSESEFGGIQGVLELIALDVKKDIAAAEEAEKNAVEDYDKQVQELDESIAAANEAITGYEQELETNQQTIVDKKDERRTKKVALDGTMTELKALKPGCDFILVNFKVRTEKRQAEIDGLKDAKAILQGGSFPSMLQLPTMQGC